MLTSGPGRSPRDLVERRPERPGPNQVEERHPRVPPAGVLVVPDASGVRRPMPARGPGTRRRDPGRAPTAPADLMGNPCEIELDGSERAVLEVDEQGAVLRRQDFSPPAHGARRPLRADVPPASRGPLITAAPGLDGDRSHTGPAWNQAKVAIADTPVIGPVPSDLRIASEAWQRHARQPLVGKARSWRGRGR